MGSSPLTRGKPRSHLSGRRAQGLIPAHAGKTSHLKTSCGCVAAHPRSRGENQSSADTVTFVPGSSPLTRGKHSEPGISGFDWRLIPAHAGKTTPRASPLQPVRAHPRSRGENTERTEIMKAYRGSSPLTRGKPHGVPQRPVRRRLIPAHAGKTSRG